MTRAMQWAKHVADAVARHRLSRGWTQAQLACHAKMSKDQVVLLENRRTESKLSSIEPAAIAFDLSVWELLEEVESSMVCDE